MRLLATLAAIVVTAALAFVLLFGRSWSVSVMPPPPPATQTVTAPQQPPPASLRETSMTTPARLPAAPIPKASATPEEEDSSIRPPQLALEGLPPASEQMVANAVAGQAKGSARARALFALLPRLPEEALASTTEEAVQNLPNGEYNSVALPLVTNPLTHGQEMSVLFADLMERPDPITMPALLAIARNPSHPYAGSALDNLKLILRQNHGADWSKWDEAIKQTLGERRAPNIGR